MNTVSTTVSTPENQWHIAIESCEEKFNAFDYLDFKQEQIFATQALMNNDYLLNIAKENPSSLKLAMYNVAALGLSLNSNLGLAYLVPRMGKIIVDISYRGLIALGVECGAIKWSKAELVYEQDDFVYRGPACVPDHQCDPFVDDRGNLRGGYCIAELVAGGVLVEAMSKADMDKIKHSSEAFKKGYGPWIEWESQMQLKSIVKRAYKWWPKSTPRMARAIQVLNEENGEGLLSLAANNGPVKLPPPPDAQDVSGEVRASVDKLVSRAIHAGAFEACRELMVSRIKNPMDLSFALSELDKAKLSTAAASNVKKAVNS